MSLLDSVLVNVLNGEHKSRGKKELIEIDSGNCSKRVLLLIMNHQNYIVAKLWFINHN
jgi:hypothetical protein